VDALLNFEGSDRFGVVSGFVNVSRHRNNLLVNQLGAFLFGKRKVLRRRITLGNGRLICRLISQRVNLQIGHFPWIENQTWNQQSHYRKGAHFTARTIEWRNAVARFFVASQQGPEFSHPTSTDALSPTRTSQGDFTPTMDDDPFY